MHCEVRSSLQAACAIGHRPLPGEGAAPSPSALDQRPAYRNARCQVGCPGHPRSRYNRRGRGQLARGRERTAGLPGPGADADAAARPLHAAPRPPPTWLSPTQKTRPPRLRHTRAPPGCAAARQKVKEQREARSRRTVASTKAAGRRPQRAHRYK